MASRRQTAVPHAPEFMSNTFLGTQKARRLPRTYKPYLLLTLAGFLLISQFWLWTGRDNHEASSNLGPDTHDHQHMEDLDSLRYQPTERPEHRILPPSTWTCTLEGDTSGNARKSRQCVVQHVCVDDQGNLARQKVFARGAKHAWLAPKNLRFFASHAHTSSYPLRSVFAPWQLPDNSTNLPRHQPHIVARICRLLLGATIQTFGRGADKDALQT
ncbi:MAG: hypothetical protein J3Q66DRAFT_175070 [Benniella sp.]|nr:MAG: hypothetical protein J3Q66DRAFT_175070 [Benniella sp.]